MLDFPDISREFQVPVDERADADSFNFNVHADHQIAFGPSLCAAPGHDHPKMTGGAPFVVGYRNNPHRTFLSTHYLSHNVNEAISRALACNDDRIQAVMSDGTKFDIVLRNGEWRPETPEDRLLAHVHRIQAQLADEQFHPPGSWSRKELLSALRRVERELSALGEQASG